MTTRIHRNSFSSFGSGTQDRQMKGRIEPQIHMLYIPAPGITYVDLADTEGY
jgi:hypothetical protein